METSRKLKEYTRQSYLNSNQLNIALLHKGYVLPNSDKIIAIYVGKNAKVVAIRENCSIDYHIKQVFTNNQFISYIEY